MKFAAALTSQKNGFLKQVFQKFRERRGRHGIAIVALVHKLLRIVYAMYQKGRNYVESHEEVLKFGAERLARAVALAERIDLSYQQRAIVDTTDGQVVKMIH